MLTGAYPWKKTFLFQNIFKTPQLACFQYTNAPIL